MRANRRRDTGPEKAFRSELHQRGFRFRVDFPIPVSGRSPRADIAFTRKRVAVFIDGCFWHGCPEHSQRPKTNSGYWGPKIARNIERDREQTVRAETAGWRVIRIWEHEGLDEAIARVEAAITGQ